MTPDKKDQINAELMAAIREMGKEIERNFEKSLEKICSRLETSMDKVQERLTAVEETLKNQDAAIKEVKQGQEDCNSKIYDLNLEVYHTQAALEKFKLEMREELNRSLVIEERLAARNRVVLIADPGTELPSDDPETLSNLCGTQIKFAKAVRGRDGATKMTLTLQNEEEATQLVKKKRVANSKIFREQGPMGRKESWLARQVMKQVRIMDEEGRYRWVWGRQGLMVVDALDKKWARYPVWGHAESMDLAGRMSTKDLTPAKTIETVRNKILTGGEPTPTYLTIPPPPPKPTPPPPPSRPAPSNRDASIDPRLASLGSRRSREEGSGVTPMGKSARTTMVTEI